MKRGAVTRPPNRTALLYECLVVSGYLLPPLAEIAVSFLAAPAFDEPRWLRDVLLDEPDWWRDPGTTVWDSNTGASVPVPVSVANPFSYKIDGIFRGVVTHPGAEHRFVDIVLDDDKTLACMVELTVHLRGLAASLFSEEKFRWKLCRAQAIGQGASLRASVLRERSEQSRPYALFRLPTGPLRCHEGPVGAPPFPDWPCRTDGMLAGDTLRSGDRVCLMLRFDAFFVRPAAVFLPVRCEALWRYSPAPKTNANPGAPPRPENKHERLIGRPKMANIAVDGFDWDRLDTTARL